MKNRSERGDPKSCNSGKIKDALGPEPSDYFEFGHTKKVSGPGDGLRMQLHVRLLPGTIFPEIVTA